MKKLDSNQRKVVAEILVNLSTALIISGIVLPILNKNFKLDLLIFGGISFTISLAMMKISIEVVKKSYGR